MQWLNAGLGPCGKSYRESSAATLSVEIVRMVQGALIDPTPARLFETWLVRMPRGLNVDYRVVGAILLYPCFKNPAEHSEHGPSYDANSVHIRASRAVPFETMPNGFGRTPIAKILWSRHRERGNWRSTVTPMPTFWGSQHSDERLHLVRFHWPLQDGLRRVSKSPTSVINRSHCLWSFLEKTEIHTYSRRRGGWAFHRHRESMAQGSKACWSRRCDFA
jgi:hypothetical protein